MDIILNNLPKVSLNTWYAGTHWTKRKNIKDAYILLIRSQTELFFDTSKCYNVAYRFEFKNNPLDASNCSAMAKLIEDILFESDGYKVVKSITIKSRKAKQDRVLININEL